MEDDEITVLATAFIERHSQTHVWDKDMVLRKVDKSGTDWENYKICEIAHERPTELWLLVLEVLRRTEDSEVLAELAAGPLEDYLVRCGDHVIAAVETHAATDERMKHLLGGVWKDSMSDDVWQRVCRCRGEPW